MAKWLLRGIDYCDNVFKSHAKYPALRQELRGGAIHLAHVHGRLSGAIAALKPLAPGNMLIEERILSLKFQYVETRCTAIERLSSLYLDALIMLRDVNLKPGRPRLRLPDYDALERAGNGEVAKEIVRYAFEFEIAVKLAEERARSGKFTGLQRLLTEAVESGKLDDVGDTAQRIKRLARQIHADSNLYLSPGLRAARQTARLFVYSVE